MVYNKNIYSNIHIEIITINPVIKFFSNDLFNKRVILEESVSTI